jgi:predicted P-loop ATPase
VWDVQPINNDKKREALPLVNHDVVLDDNQMDEWERVFGGDEPDIREVSEPNQPSLDLTKDGQPYCSQENIQAVLKLEGIRVWYDELAYNYRIEGLTDWASAYLEDASIREIQEICRTKHGFSPSKSMTYETVMRLAEKHQRHPVEEYLDGLTWDGKRRLATWLIDYAGADDTELNREVGKLILVAAVRRVKQPGVKYDLLPILEGPQGSGKSSLVRILAVKDDWYGENVSLGMKPEKLMETTAGTWLNEIGELRGNNRADMDALKSMLSRQVDVARMAYDRMPTHRPRQWTMVGTTNSSQPLRDQTGNRRFLPIPTKQIRLRELEEVVNQLWAEAVEVERSHGPLELPRSLWDDARAIQDSRTARDPWEDVLEEYSEGVPVGTKILRHVPYEMVGFPDGDYKQIKQNDAQRMNEIMRRLGWDGPKSVRTPEPGRGWEKT